MSVLEPGAGATPSPSPTTELANPLVELPQGRGLTVADAEPVVRSASCSLVLLAGGAKCGKTTLLATLYLLYQKGPFAGYRFAGSRTLVGFEERTYFARVASRQPDPRTERTVVSELLHLRLQDLSARRPHEVLLCDFSAENFEEARDSGAACVTLPGIGRVDQLALLVDGERIVDPTTRRRAKNDPMTLLRNCLDNQAFNERVQVDLIVTKWDKILSSPERSELELYVDEMESDARGRFEKRIRTLRTARVSCHSAPELQLPLGHGLEPLFGQWVQSGLPTPSPRIGRPAPSPDATEYDRFGYCDAAGLSAAK